VADTTPKLPDEGLAGVAAMVAAAEEPGSWMARVGSSDDPIPQGQTPTGLTRNGIAAGQWLPDDNGLPPDCPVIPLGVDDNTYWFLDTLGQLRALEFGQFGQKAINSLFMGRHHYLYWAWPRTNKDGQVVAWRQEKAAEDLMGACARKGPWNAVDRARGRGAWTLQDGRLLIHCGTQLWENAKLLELGEIEGDVYMTRPAIRRPWPTSFQGMPGPALRLYPVLQTWNWARPEIDPVLLMGWIAAAMIGGALPWRPIVYLTGDKATGKSSLQRLLKFIFGNMLIQSGNATAAGIYQLLRHDALPVSVDENEAKADARRAKALLELARQASDNQLLLRGGESHKGVQFYARSCFAFSSINHPPAEPQDWSRMAFLALYKFKPGAIEPDLDERKWGRTGQMILRRMIDGWHRFPETFRQYKEMLASAGHDGRGQNTFGVLLACADLLVDCDGETLGLALGSNLDDPTRAWAKHFEAANLREYEDAEENWRLCLNHMLSARVEAWRSGSRQTVGEVLMAYRHSPLGEALSFDEARHLLQKAGLSLQKADERFGEAQLIVPNQHALLAELFKDTKWQGEPGSGVWAGALRQAPQEDYQLAQAWVSGVKGRAIAFPLTVVLRQAAPGAPPQVEAEF
jgi:hypothetical protein